MRPTRISRVPSRSWLIYTAPGGGHIHRVFDTATINGSLVEVPFTHQDDGSVRLKNDPASDVWVEHDDMTISPKSEKAYGLGALEPLNTSTQTTGSLDGVTRVTNLGALQYGGGRLTPDQVSGGTLGKDATYSTRDLESRDSGVRTEPDPRLDEIITLLKRIASALENQEAQRRAVFA